MNKCCSRTQEYGMNGCCGFNGCSLKSLAIFVLILNRFTDIDGCSLEFIIALFYLFCSPSFC